MDIDKYHEAFVDLCEWKSDQIRKLANKMYMHDWNHARHQMEMVRLRYDFQGRLALLDYALLPAYEGTV